MEISAENMHVSSIADNWRLFYGLKGHQYNNDILWHFAQTYRAAVISRLIKYCSGSAEKYLVLYSVVSASQM